MTGVHGPSEAGLGRPLGGTYTFGGRRGRTSPTRQRSLDTLVPRYLAKTPLDRAQSLLVEVGCGKGEATAAMASGGDRDALVVACEANASAIAHLASLLDRDRISNVRLWLGDALELLQRLDPGSIDEVRVWFPDPWPKSRQAGRRLVTPERFALIVSRLRVGGRLRLATDDPGYAGQTLAAIVAEPRLAGGTVERPSERPVTAFEARSARAGRATIDIEARRLY